MTNNKKSIIILMGPPGSGKGTEAGLLAEKFGLYSFETSKLLEAAFAKTKKGDYFEVDGKKYSLTEEKKLWERGILNSPRFVAKVVISKIEELFRSGEDIIFSGSPRTLEEGKIVIPFLERTYGKKNISVMLLEIPAKETVFRNSRRRICQLMRHPILYSKENEKLKFCPLDGSRLLRRKGLDDPASIKVRLEEYENRTYPMLDYFKERGLKVKKINGMGSVSLVFNRLLSVLK